jgi:hypothetical protein
VLPPNPNKGNGGNTSSPVTLHPGREPAEQDEASATVGASYTLDDGIKVEELALPGTAPPGAEVPRHPAKFTDAIYPALAAAVPPEQYPRVLDPFAGVGGVHQLPNVTVGVELQWRWARARPGTLMANAFSLPFPAASFDAVVTSPCYGNRLADHHEARDGSVRHSYTHDYGEPLHPDNTGAVQWGEKYRADHERAWREAVRVLRAGRRFVLNVSDHIRNGERQPVTDWHVATLTTLGLVEVRCVNVPTPRLRKGANADARVEHEHVITFDKPDDR